MSIEVGTLEHDDVDRASQLLSRAFAADPIITFYLRGRRRKMAVPLFFAAVLQQMLPSGHVYVAVSGDPVSGDPGGGGRRGV